MVLPLHAPDTIIVPDPQDALVLQELERRMGELIHDHHGIHLAGPDDEQLAVPDSVFHALKLVVDAMAMGITITLVPHGKELTTQQAADMLHISRPYLIDKLLEGGEIPFHRVGRDRRLRIEDVLDYRERRAAQRRDAARKLTQLSQEVEGGYR
jgi:excisionase family DNA binding protein